MVCNLVTTAHLRTRVDGEVTPVDVENGMKAVFGENIQSPRSQ